MIPAPPLSPLRRAAVEGYVRELRNALGLGHWSILLPDEYPSDDPEGVWAEITPTEGRYRAKLRFGTGFFELDAEETRNTIVHELLHLHFNRAGDVVRLGPYRQELGQTLYNSLHEQVKTEIEYGIDALATIIAKRLPLPLEKWPDAAE